MFEANPPGEYTYEQDKTPTAALAAEGFYPPPGVGEWLRRPIKDRFNERLYGRF